MTDNLELARRAVACKHWRWMPGMLLVVGLRIDGADVDGRPVRKDTRYSDLHGKDVECSIYAGWSNEPQFPDLTDSATLGCLLALVRDAWSDPGLVCTGSWSRDKWAWRISGGKPHGKTFRDVAERWFETESAALVAALERAT